MASDGSTIVPNKAHRVSRHVSFQAVVPPSVAFPVNYSGPSHTQKSKNSLNTRQSVTDLPNSELDESLPDDFKLRIGRQMSTVIALECDRDSRDESSLATFDKVRSKFASLNISTEKPCFFGNFRLNRKNPSISKRKCLIIASILIPFIVLILIIIAIVVGISNGYPTPGGRIFGQRLGVCESTGCLRIGLFFQTTLAKINMKGIVNSCSEISLRNLVTVIWNAKTSTDIMFQSPLAEVIDLISQENSADDSILKNCILIARDDVKGSFSVQNVSEMSKILFAYPPIDYGQNLVPIARILQEVTFTFNSFGKSNFNLCFPYYLWDNPSHQLLTGNDV